jgi:AcrR family transcriptional regulator
MSDQKLNTQERIIKAAGDLFGNRGFKDTTIRAIAQAADVNIAAINYHFKDKEGLYGAVLEDVFQTGFTRFPALLKEDVSGGPEQKLRGFIRSMFYRLQSTEGWAGFSGKGKLIARELLDPSPALEPMLDKYIKPHKDLLVSIIADIMKVDPGSPKLIPCAISIIGQCIYYALASKLITKIIADNGPTQDSLDQLAEFVWVFSMGGIARIRDESLLTAKEQP